MGPALNKPGFGGNWQTLRKNTDSSYVEGNKIAQDKYVASVDKLKINGVQVVQVTPKGYNNRANAGKIGVYLHGGAYVTGKPDIMLANYAPLSSMLGIRVIAVDYRLAPEHPFPAGLNDCYAVYQALLRRSSPTGIIIWGDSAGGALVLSLLLKAKQGGLAMPAAVSLLYPWADITKTGDTYDTLAPVDPVLTNADIQAAAKVYVPAGVNPKNSLISPVYGTYSRDFPPTQIIVGTRDIFLSNVARMQRVLRSVGVEVDLLVFEGMWHGFHPWIGMPEASVTDNDMAAFFRRYIK